MTVLITALAFLVLLSLLILIHELGHFAVARFYGVTVEEFGFGLPPRVRTLFVRGGTMFSLNWIPFGGFVRLRGENAMTQRDRRASGSFGAASIPARIQILAAGVFMNFLLALIIFTVGFSVGQWVPTYLSLEAMEAAAVRGEISMEKGVLIAEVQPGSTAEAAELPVQSLVVAVDGQPVIVPEDISRLQEGKTTVQYSILTGEGFSEERTVTVGLRDGKAGVALAPFPRSVTAPTRSFVPAVILSLREAKLLTYQTIVGMGSLFASLVRSGTVPEGITGIVGIAQLTYVSVQDGFLTYLRLVALLSLSLAVLNILPFPALDGGRLLFVLVEFLGRRPLNRRFEVLVNTAGFCFLLLLIILITFHDILRLF